MQFSILDNSWPECYAKLYKGPSCVEVIRVPASISIISMWYCRARVTLLKCEAQALVGLALSERRAFAFGGGVGAVAIAVHRLGYDRNQGGRCKNGHQQQPVDRVPDGEGMHWLNPEVHRHDCRERQCQQPRPQPAVKRGDRDRGIEGDVGRKRAQPFQELHPQERGRRHHGDGQHDPHLPYLIQIQ